MEHHKPFNKISQGSALKLFLKLVMSHNFEKTDSMSELSSLSVKSRISFIEEFKDFKKNRPKPPIQSKPVKPPEKPAIPARKPPEINPDRPKIPDRTDRPNGPSNIEANKNTDEKSASHKPVPKTPAQKPKGQTDNDLLSKDNYSEVNKYAYFRIE